jgi:predicted RNA-binding protein with PIN domain
MILPDVPERGRLMASVGAPHWFVDASNVIGSRPDGWWRDRDGATRRLIAAVRAWAAAEHAKVTVVLDAGEPELATDEDGVAVVLAPRRGRNAADDEIVRLIADVPAARVVTSDAELAARARAAGAEVEGAGRFRNRLAY